MYHKEEGNEERKTKREKGKTRNKISHVKINREKNEGREGRERSEGVGRPLKEEERQKQREEGKKHIKKVTKAT